MTKSTPRSYQQYIFEQAKKENVIAVLETGTGKTLISIMLIEHVMTVMKNSDDESIKSKKIVMLTPNTLLAKQQASSIREELDLKHEDDVDVYLGDSGVLDLHSAKSQRMKKKKILVMTPQVFQHLLSHCQLKMDNIALLILDECHHCMEDHPYRVVMKHFYHTAKNKPKVLGMTASPIRGTDLGTMMQKRAAIEANMDCKIVTVSGDVEKELNQYVQTTNEHILRYENNLDNHLLSKLRMECERYELYGKGMEDIAQEFGLCAVVRIVKRLANDQMIQLEAVMSQLEAKFTFEKTASDKFMRLVDLLTELRSDNDFKAIIFVERRSYARCLFEMLQMYGPKFINCDYITSTNTANNGIEAKLSRDHQAKATKAFRDGEINVLIATSVAEEGLDIQTCDLVVRFNIATNLISHVQSRGRARVKAAKYYTLVDMSDPYQEQVVRKIKKSEQLSKEVTRLPSTLRDNDAHTNDSVVYRVESTGAVATPENSVSLLNHYCNKIGGHFQDYCLPETGLGPFACIISLPSTCPLEKREYMGPRCQRKNDAKRLTALKIIEVLHKSGELNDKLLPAQKLVYQNVAIPLENAGVNEFQKHLPDCFNANRSNTVYMYRIMKDGTDTQLEIGLFAKVKNTGDPLKLYVRSPTPSMITLEFSSEIELSSSNRARLSATHDLLMRQINPNNKTQRLSFYLSYQDVADTLVYRKTYDTTNNLYLISDTPAPIRASDRFLGSETYCDYYKKKYGIVLKDPKQHLVTSKQISVSNFTYYKEKKKKAGPAHNHLVPELLEKTKVPASAFETLALLPSLLHLLEIRLHATEINEIFNLQCPVDLIMSAITAPAVDAVNNYERLEFLGDSVLKYVTCLHNFRQYPNEREGPMSSVKQIEVSNRKLYDLATEKRLPGYICQDPFQKKLWLESHTSMKLPMKTISDVVESIIGACYTHGGLHHAIDFCVQLGLDVHSDHYPPLPDPYADVWPSSQDIQSAQSFKIQCTDVLWLVQAFTHGSVPNMPSYQRLEFLGDAALDLLVNERLMESNRAMNPGELTKMKTDLVNNNALAAVACEYDLDRLVKCGDPHIIKDIKTYKLWMSSNKTDWFTKRAPKVLADVLEATVGAVIVDCEFDLSEAAVKLADLVDKVITFQKRISAEIPDPEDEIQLTAALPQQNRDYVSELQIYCQKRGLPVPNYNFVSAGTGTELTVTVTVNNKLLELGGVTKAPNKKEAKKIGAMKALAELENNPSLIRSK